MVRGDARGAATRAGAYPSRGGGGGQGGTSAARATGERGTHGATGDTTARCEGRGFLPAGPNVVPGSTRRAAPGDRPRPPAHHHQEVWKKIGGGVISLLAMRSSDPLPGDRLDVMSGFLSPDPRADVTQKFVADPIPWALCLVFGHKPAWIFAAVPNPYATESRVWGCARCRKSQGRRR